MRLCGPFLEVPDALFSPQLALSPRRARRRPADLYALRKLSRSAAIRQGLRSNGLCVVKADLTTFAASPMCRGGSSIEFRLSDLSSSSRSIFDVTSRVPSISSTAVRERAVRSVFSENNPQVLQISPGSDAPARGSQGPERRPPVSQCHPFPHRAHRATRAARSTARHLVDVFALGLDVPDYS